MSNGRNRLIEPVQDRVLIRISSRELLLEEKIPGLYFKSETMGVSNLYVLVLFSLLLTPTFAAKKSYIVYLGTHSHGKNPTADDINRARNHHHNFLGSFFGSVKKARDSISCSYGRHINGFAAILEEEHAQQLAKHPEVLSIFLDEGRKVQTTRSWDFLGLEKDNVISQNSAWNKGRFGEDVIIGVIDSGVWPESKSFSDEGMGPVPSRWRGICQNDTHYGFQCNRKLIGMRYYNQGQIEHARAQNSSFYPTPEHSTARDLDGHGTHAASTAVGNVVANVSVFGNGYGTAKGGSPRARLASYKSCWNVNGQPLDCRDSDILSAFDDAIHDGVDVLSVSLGEPSHKNTEYFKDAIAIGSFHAMMHGILVVAAAGNEGPKPDTVVNLAPWLLTVGASTMDREFTSYVTLGDEQIFKGKSIAAKGVATQTLYSLITGDNARATNAALYDSLECNPGAIDPKKINGKILLCMNHTHGIDKSQLAAQAGAAGLILVNPKQLENESLPLPYHLPTSLVEFDDAQSIIAYNNSIKNPVASVSDVKTEFNTKPSPQMTFFSSRGPSTINPNIIKPDITAPGVEIIAAYSEAVAPSKSPSDDRRIPFNACFGTSMSTPHISGIAGLLKTLHPDWSPAAIKSAIMTTATTTDHTGKNPITDYDGLKATPFEYGAGHVNPNSAMDPGLVYDLSFYDYLSYICSRGYNQSIINNFTTPEIHSCPKSFSILDFNYPTIAIPDLNESVTITRRVKNVGTHNSSYEANVEGVDGVSVVVEPNNLSFTEYGEERTFKVTFTPERNVEPKPKAEKYIFGKLIWSDSDGLHHVSSSIALQLL